MAFLHCPSCRFAVSETAARSPYQACPRCLARKGLRRTMVSAPGPFRRFTRPAAAFERITEASARREGSVRSASTD